MRRLTFGLTILAVGIFGLWLLSATPTYAQCVLVGRQRICAQPPPPPGPGTGPSHPEITFSEGAPFQVSPPPPPTATSTPMPLPTNTPTNTPTNAPTHTPTSTPTVTPTPFAKTIMLNEVLPQPKNTDWNGDAALNPDDEWIELYNASTTSVDLSGWQLAAIGGTSAMTYTIPASTTISARGFSIFFRRQTKLEINGADIEVRLRYPNGSAVDAVRFAQLRSDQTYARSVDGGGYWTPNCVPSPDSQNCVRVATTTSSFNLPFFQKHIADPSILSKLNVSVLTTNLLLALILALAFGFFGNLLNDAVESHEEHVQSLIAPLRRLTGKLQHTGSQIDAALRVWRPLFWLGFLLRLAVLMFIYGFILAFLDPSFAMPDKDGWLLILALALSAGLVSLIDDIAQYIYLRLHDSDSTIRIHSGNLILVLFTTLFSRFSGLVPGLLVGSPAGIEDVKDPDFEIKSHLLGIGSIIAVSAGAWLLSPLFDADAWFKTLFLLIFAAGVQTLFFEMLPLKYLHGQGVYQFNRVLWLGLFVIATTVFLQTMLNPDGAFVSAFNSPNMVLLSIVVIAFCIFSTAVWFYLQRLEKLETAKAVSTTQGEQ